MKAKSPRARKPRPKPKFSTNQVSPLVPVSESQIQSFMEEGMRAQARAAKRNKSGGRKKK